MDCSHQPADCTDLSQGLCELLCDEEVAKVGSAGNLGKKTMISVILDYPCFGSSHSYFFIHSSAILVCLLINVCIY